MLCFDDHNYGTGRYKNEIEKFSFSKFQRGVSKGFASLAQKQIESFQKPAFGVEIGVASPA